MSYPPNLLLITTDQHRWDWLGCHGTSGVQTPHLDRLAARGMRFTHHVTNSAICAPARIGLATGIAPVRLGTLTNGDVLPAGVDTYYQLLRDAGYRVGVVGKLDLNKPDRENGRHGNRPDTYRWGFTDPVEVEGKMHAGTTAPDQPVGPYGWWLREQGLFERFVDDYVERMTEIIMKNYGDQEPDAAPGTRFYDDSVLPTEAFADTYIGRRACQWLQ
ncbi:MAG: sulfatase-like hydrolase/transferase, partial [Acidimicrobiales bacterium]